MSEEGKICKNLSRLDDKKVKFLSQGKSYIKHISEKKIKEAVNSGKLKQQQNFPSFLKLMQSLSAFRPLDEHREPDMSYVVNTAKTIAKYLRKGQLVTLESTSYPRTTDEFLQPLFENAANAVKNKFKVGKDFYLAFSPERGDPNNQDY